MSNIEKIKAEIEKRKGFFHERGIGCDNAIEVELESLLSFIDSLPEESVSEDLEKVADEYSKGLDYWNYINDDPSIAFKAGAAWQKEQMMKEAVDADVNTYEELPSGMSYVEFVADIPASRFKKHNKVKLVILKDDESSKD